MATSISNWFRKVFFDPRAAIDERAILEIGWASFAEYDLGSW